VEFFTKTGVDFVPQYYRKPCYFLWSTTQVKLSHMFQIQASMLFVCILLLLYLKAHMMIFKTFTFSMPPNRLQSSKLP